MARKKKVRTKQCRPIKEYFFGDPRIDMGRSCLFLSEHFMLRRHLVTVSEAGTTVEVSYCPVMDAEGAFKASEAASLEELAAMDMEAGRGPMKFMGYLLGAV